MPVEKYRSLAAEVDNQLFMQLITNSFRERGYLVFDQDRKGSALHIGCHQVPALLSRHFEIANEVIHDCFLRLGLDVTLTKDDMPPLNQPGSDNCTFSSTFAIKLPDLITEYTDAQKLVLRLYVKAVETRGNDTMSVLQSDMWDVVHAEYGRAAKAVLEKHCAGVVPKHTRQLISQGLGTRLCNIAYSPVDAPFSVEECLNALGELAQICGMRKPDYCVCRTLPFKNKDYQTVAYLAGYEKLDILDKEVILPFLETLSKI